jgi:hypothetical protein
MSDGKQSDKDHDHRKQAVNGRFTAKFFTPTRNFQQSKWKTYKRKVICVDIMP